MFLRHAEPQDIFTVARNMRERDYREISALRYDDDRNEMAYNITNQIAEFETVYVVGDTEPVAIVSYIPVRPGVWNLGMFATDRFKCRTLPDKAHYPRYNTSIRSSQSASGRGVQYRRLRRSTQLAGFFGA